MSKLLSVQEAAVELGVTGRRVNQLIRAGRLAAEKVGSQYVIKESDIEKVRERPAGRPPKDKEESK